MAVTYYEQALEYDPPPAEALAPGVTGGVDSTDLRREAAHNLASVFAASGSRALARKTLRRYCTV